MVQTRSESTGLREFQTVEEAMSHAKHDVTVWKVSFNLGNERVRFVRDLDRDSWFYEKIELSKVK